MEFKPNAYDLDEEYRKRSERYARHQRFVQSVRKPNFIWLHLAKFQTRITAYLMQWWNAQQETITEETHAEEKITYREKRIGATQ